MPSIQLEGMEGGTEWRDLEFAPQVGDLVRHGGRWYEVKSVTHDLDAGSTVVSVERAIVVDA